MYWGMLAVYNIADDLCLAWLADIVAWESYQCVKLHSHFTLHALITILVAIEEATNDLGRVESRMRRSREDRRGI